MLEFKKPIPVVVEGNKDGYAIYVTDSGMFENDIWCVVLCDGGIVRHYNSSQIRIFHNATFDIKKDETLQCVGIDCVITIVADKPSCLGGGENEIGK